MPKKTPGGKPVKRRYPARVFLCLEAVFSLSYFSSYFSISISTVPWASKLMTSAVRGV